jgi:hypothetical protein
MALIVLGLVSAPSLALASPEFPEELRAEFNHDCMPTCLLCHDTLQGGSANVQGGFVTAMAGAPAPQLQQRRPETVIPALEKLRENTVDSDGDTVNDYDEVAQGTNPNGDEIDFCLAGPQYGCFASRVEPRGTLDGWGAALALLLLGFFGLLRSRRVR